VIEWRQYGDTREMQPESHVPKLVSNGAMVKVAVHQIDRVDRVYRWYDQFGYTLSGITHYAEINLPKDGDSHA
jgi:hypothetical protein